MQRADDGGCWLMRACGSPPARRIVVPCSPESMWPAGARRVFHRWPRFLMLHGSLQ